MKRFVLPVCQALNTAIAHLRNALPSGRFSGLARYQPTASAVGTRPQQHSARFNGLTPITALATRHTARLLLILLTLLALTLSVTASAPPSKKITICLLPKKKGVPYFTTCAKGAEEAAKELGDTLIYDGPTDGSPEKAASMVDRWILQGVDVIAVSPNDPEVVGQAMKKARAKGIHVITWDADAAKDTREFMVNQATAKDIGYALVDAMAKDLGGTEPEGKVAIITAALTAANQNEWMKYMKERLEHYPKLSLIATKPSNEDQRLAFQVAQDLMKANPDLKGIFGISSVAFPGAAEAVKQAGKSGKVLVTGLATPNDMKAYVKDGTVKSVILWNTIDLGYLTIQAAHALATHKLKPGAKDLPAGRLGIKSIEGDQILLGKILVFTKDNIDQFDF